MSVIIQDAREGGFVKASKSQERREELEKFLQEISSGKNIRGLCLVTTVEFNEEGDPIELKHNGEAMRLFVKMKERIFSGEQKVNGKKGNWSNGSFGSRWYDDYNKYMTCRVAFQSRATSTTWEFKEPYMLAFVFEPRPASQCGNYDECKNEGHGYRLCSACEVTRYCSAECHKKHWKTHKKMCEVYKKENEAE